MKYTFSPHQLDWPEVVDQGAKYTHSDPGFERFQSLKDPAHWAENREQANQWQEKTKVALELLSESFLWDAFLGNPFVDSYLEQLFHDQMLTTDALSDLRKWLHTGSIWFRFLKKQDSLSKPLNQLKRSLFDCSPYLKSLNQVLTDEGELSESASKTLQELSSEKRRLRK